MAKHIKFSGGRETDRALLELSTKSALRIGRQVLRRVAREMLLAIRARAPQETGLLAKNLEVRVDRGRSSKSLLLAMVRVKPLRRYRTRKTDRQSRVKGKLGAPRYTYQIGTTPEVYGAFQEFGTRHIAPKGYFRSVWDRLGGQAALDNIGGELGPAIEREAARLAKGG